MPLLASVCPHSSPPPRSAASFAGHPPFPVTRHVSQCNSRPGGPMRLHSSTECGVNTPRRRPSSQIHRPTKRSHVRTWLHSSLTKFGYYVAQGRRRSEGEGLARQRDRDSSACPRQSHLHHADHRLLGVAGGIEDVGELGDGRGAVRLGDRRRDDEEMDQAAERDDF